MTILKKIAIAYLLSYLIFGGLLFLVMPQLGLKLFTADQAYHSLFVRLSGALLLGLATFVVLGLASGDRKFIKKAIVVRLVILIGMLVIYLIHRETLILMLMGVVSFGALLSFLAESRSA